MSKPRKQMSMTRDLVPVIGYGMILWYPNDSVRAVFTSNIVRIEAIGFYIVEIETENTIYEIID